MNQCRLVKSDVVSTPKAHLNYKLQKPTLFIQKALCINRNTTDSLLILSILSSRLRNLRLPSYQPFQTASLPANRCKVNFNQYLA
jgi:hypothetical protein